LLVEANIGIARSYAEKYLLLGWAVICPHMNYAHMDDLGYELLLAADMELIRRCDVIVMLPNWKRSHGAMREHAFAKKLKKEIIYEGGQIP